MNEANFSWAALSDRDLLEYIADKLSNSNQHEFLIQVDINAMVRDRVGGLRTVKKLQAREEAIAALRRQRDADI